MSEAGWSAALRFALRLGIQPEAFWRLSVREWRMLTGVEAPLRASELGALMTRFPDAAQGSVRD